MAPELTVADLGEEVPLPEIGRRLKALWESNRAMTRASLTNFAVYSECPGSLDNNTALIQRITREHACRAILMAVEPAAAAPEVRAWITAHCQIGDGGGRHVCSEQLAFLIRGCGHTVVANTLFAHVDSDLPLTLWWQGEFSENWQPWLFTEIDRLVIDSSDWEDPAGQFDILERSWRHHGSEFSVNDLTWTRVLHLRMALAACFDDPVALALVPQIETVDLTCPAGHMLAGQMFAAWMAHRAGWKFTGPSADAASFDFTSAAGRPIRIAFHAGSALTPVPAVEVRAPGLTVKLAHDDDSPFIRSTQTTAAGTAERLTPCPCRSPSELVIERLRRGCNTTLYFTLLDIVRKLMPAA